MYRPCPNTVLAFLQRVFSVILSFLLGGKYGSLKKIKNEKTPFQFRPHCLKFLIQIRLTIFGAINRYRDRHCITPFCCTLSCPVYCMLLPHGITNTWDEALVLIPIPVCCNDHSGICTISQNACCENE